MGRVMGACVCPREKAEAINSLAMTWCYVVKLNEIFLKLNVGIANLRTPESETELNN